jgi:hypothetical protein
MNLIQPKVKNNSKWHDSINRYLSMIEIFPSTYRVAIIQPLAALYRLSGLYKMVGVIARAGSIKDYF